MRNLRRILVAIKDPGRRHQPVLRKAAQLAAASGARLELFHAICEPVYLDAFIAAGMSLQQVQRQFRDKTLARLEKLAAPLRHEGLAVGTGCELDFPAYDAVIRRAQRVDADLIVAERHAKKHMLPWLLRFNDWELLRRSPVPVLLIKRPQAWHRPPVLAAIDPSHGFARPARLDDEILAAANLVSVALSGKLHVAHAWPGEMLLASDLGAITADQLAGMRQRAERSARRAFADALERSGISDARRHFVPGQAVDVIPALARKQRAGIVVMGAISRSGLKRLVVGNIAEQVLDALSSDVLVVKPTDFKPRTATRTRGIQLVPTPPYV